MIQSRVWSLKARLFVHILLSLINININNGFYFVFVFLFLLLLFTSFDRVTKEDQFLF